MLFLMADMTSPNQSTRNLCRSRLNRWIYDLDTPATSAIEVFEVRIVALIEWLNGELIEIETKCESEREENKSHGPNRRLQRKIMRTTKNRQRIRWTK